MLRTVIIHLKKVNPGDDFINTLRDDLIHHQVSVCLIPPDNAPVLDFSDITSCLSCTYRECIVITDNKQTVISAKKAGLPVLGYCGSGYDENLNHLDYIIEGFEEVDTRYLQQIYQRLIGEPVLITETKRLLIRELSVDDIVTKHQIQYPDDDLPTAIDKHTAYVRNYYHFYNYGYWGVFQKNDNILVGRCGFQNNTVNDITEIELGYLIDQPYQGIGYATESVNAVIQYAFERLSIHRIVAVIDDTNEKSKSVAMAVGMKAECSLLHEGRQCTLYVINNND